MATAVEICNGAFDLLGSRTIAALTDDSKEGRLATRLYANTRDEVLRAHPWNFALTRAALTADGTPPAWGFVYRYALPADCLRLLNLDGANFEVWRVEGRWLLTDVGSPVNVLYVASVADTSVYDPMFVSALEAALAAKMAYPLAGSRELMLQMTQLFQARLALARSMDAIENGLDIVESPVLLDARL